MKRGIAIFLCCVIAVLLSACSEMDPDYGKSDTASAAEKGENTYEDIKMPEIMSDDEVMPTYFDISLYDEENYADIYLGKKFNFNVTYNGGSITVPSSYKKMTKSGWILVESNEYNEDSQIFAGKSLSVNFVDKYNKQIVAVFYNSSGSSAPLKKCPIVKFIIPENLHNNDNSVYGQFWVNGINNDSAITDIVEFLGSPSHFYKVDEGKYYLDYFITENDKRSGITIYIDTVEDSVDSIEFSYY